MPHGSQDIQQEGRQRQDTEEARSGPSQPGESQGGSRKEKKCAHCSATFLDWYGRGKYCSKQCAGKGRQLNEPNKICVVCGVGFRVPPKRIAVARFCSPKCKGVSLRGTSQPKPHRSFKDSIPIFWESVDKRGENECWPWIGCRLAEGYGRFKSEGKFIAAHRFSFILHKGMPPVDKPCVLHECDNPPCCNPKHLFPGTKKDNTDDCIKKGRHPWQSKIRHDIRPTAA